jgi:hypothetical protein
MKKSTVIFDMNLTIFRSVSRELADLEMGKLPIEPMPMAIETFLAFFRQDYQVVIISSSDIQSSRERLEFLLQEYGLTQPDIKELLKKIDILSMQFFGSKHTKEAWLQAMQPYSNIEYIFEDSEAKLHAAGEAAVELGNDPQLFTSIADFADV